MSVIRFEQAAFINNHNDRIELYEQRFHQVMRCFTKSTFLQLKAWSLWEKLQELSEPVSEKDYSAYLFKKLDECFVEFENLQNDPKFIESRDMIVDFIKLVNEKGLLKS